MTKVIEVKNLHKNFKIYLPALTMFNLLKKILSPQKNKEYYRIIKALNDIQYTGWIMVERDNRLPDYVQSAKNMRQVLRNFGY